VSANYYLLIHGLGLSCAVWKPLEAFANKRARIIAPDLPGHGKGPRFESPCGYEFSLMWGYILFLLSRINDVEKHENTILVLHSMAAGLLPEIADGKWRPKAIVLVEGNVIQADAGWSSRISEMEDAEYKNWIVRLRKNAIIIMRNQLRSVQAPDDVAMWAEGLRSVDDTALRVIAKSLVNRTRDGHNMRALSAIDVPSVYLRGELSDPWLDGHRQLESIGVPVVVIPASAHYPMIDNPLAVWNEINSFITSLTF